MSYKNYQDFENKMIDYLSDITVSELESLSWHLDYWADDFTISEKLEREYHPMNQLEWYMGDVYGLEPDEEGMWDLSSCEDAVFDKDFDWFADYFYTIGDFIYSSTETEHNEFFESHRKEITSSVINLTVSGHDFYPWLLDINSQEKLKDVRRIFMSVPFDDDTEEL